MTPPRAEIPTGGHPHQANSAVVAFLNALGWAKCEADRRLSREHSEALEALDELHSAAAAADELTRLTDEMGLYRTDQEAS